MSNKASLEGDRATQRATDKQIGGTHYKGKIQPIELIVSHNLDNLKNCDYVYEFSNGKLNLK